MAEKSCLLGNNVEAIQCWTTLENGCLINDAGCSREFNTGDWRTGLKPLIDWEKCAKCGRCYSYCPDMAFRPKGDGTYDWLSDYCKGCGICASECPADAITMVEEE